MTDFQILMLIVIWIAFAVIVGAVASQRGREGALFFLLALVVSPLIALFIVVALPAMPKADQSTAKCPHCRGLVERGVKCCMHCTRVIYWHDKDGILLATDTPMDAARSTIAHPTPAKAPISAQLTTVEKPPEILEAECPDCGKTFPIRLGSTPREEMCPHCQSILKIDASVAAA